jgi:hypothetical protein
VTCMDICEFFACTFPLHEMLMAILFQILEVRVVAWGKIYYWGWLTVQSRVLIGQKEGAISKYATTELQMCEQQWMVSLTEYSDQYTVEGHLLLLNAEQRCHSLGGGKMSQCEGTHTTFEMCAFSAA